MNDESRLKPETRERIAAGRRRFLLSPSSRLGSESCDNLGEPLPYDFGGCGCLLSAAQWALPLVRSRVDLNAASAARPCVRVGATRIWACFMGLDGKVSP